MDDPIKLIGKKVLVVADGIIYRGELIEITDAEINLKSETGWITIPIEKVSSVRGV